MRFAEKAQHRLSGGASGVGYIWLAYSLFFFFEPFYRNEVSHWIKCLAIYAVFLASYVYFDLCRFRRNQLIVLAGWVVLGMASMYVTVGAATFFVYAASFLPFCLDSAPLVFTLLGVDFLCLIAVGSHIQTNFLNYGISAFFIFVVGTSNFFIARQKRMNCKLQMAQEEIERLAAVAERERIARDLHDVLGHTLSLIVLKAELAGRLLQRDPQRAATEIGDVERTARTALAEVREAIGGYRAQGLSAELKLARHTLDAAGVTLVCDEPPAATLTANEETVLSLAVREAVTNIVRHAEATTCSMRLTTTADGFHALVVEDNGPHAVQHEGNGLRGMRERVHALGGRFSISSEHGTRLLVELPVTNFETTGAR